MERPKVPAMDSIEAVIKDLHDTEEMMRTLNEAMQTLKTRLDEVISEIAEQTKDKDERIAAMNYLYWNVPEVKATTIAKTLFGKPSVQKLTKLISPIEVSLHCEKCRDNSVSQAGTNSRKVTRCLGGSGTSGQGVTNCFVMRAEKRYW